MNTATYAVRTPDGMIHPEPTLKSASGNRQVYGGVILTIGKGGQWEPQRQPSVWPSIIACILFAPVGWVLAIIGTVRARRLGYGAKRYWIVPAIQAGLIVLIVLIAAAGSGGGPAAPSAALPVPANAVYQPLTDQQWASIAKAPDMHASETYTVYGEVTQADTATGTTSFRADVGGTRQAPDQFGLVSYPTNTMLTGSSDTLAPVVQGDLFTARVEVVGSYTYDNTMGGGDTVPQLQVEAITVTGHSTP